MLNIFKFINYSITLLIMTSSMAQAMQAPKTLKQKIVLSQDFSMDIAYTIENEHMENTLLFIHGNSASKEFFSNLSTELLPDFRLIKVDLPGHGESDDFSMTMQEQYELNNDMVFEHYDNFYTFAGYARVMNQFIDKLSINKDKLSILGWSLGGHIAIHMAKTSHMHKVVLTGTPVQSFADMKGAFSFLKTLLVNNANFPENTSITDLLSFNKHFSAEQAVIFHAAGGFMTQDGAIAQKAGMRTNPIARSAMIHFCSNAADKLELEHMDQKAIVFSKKDTFKIIQGSQDPIKSPNNLGLDISEIEGAAHAVFHTHPKEYADALLKSLRM